MTRGRSRSISVSTAFRQRHASSGFKILGRAAAEGRIRKAIWPSAWLYQGGGVVNRHYRGRTTHQRAQFSAECPRLGEIPIWATGDLRAVVAREAKEQGQLLSAHDANPTSPACAYDGRKTEDKARGRGHGLIERDICGMEFRSVYAGLKRRFGGPETCLVDCASRPRASSRLSPPNRQYPARAPFWMER